MKYNTTKHAVECLKKYLKRYNQLRNGYPPVEIIIKITICFWDNCKETTDNQNDINNSKKIKDKLEVINTLYSTRSNKDTIKKLESAIKQHEDKLLSSDSLKEVLNYSGSQAVSLLSKYLCSIEPTIFPIYDNLAVDTLNYFLHDGKQIIKFKSSGVGYSTFVKAVDEFKKKVSFKEDYRQLDKFLWLFAKILKKQIVLDN